MKKTTIAESCTLHARIGWQGLTKKEYLNEGDYYLVTGVDFCNGHIDFKNCHYVTKDRYDQDKHIQIHEGDVLVTKDGTIGKVAIIDEPVDKPATLNSGVFVVRPKNENELLPRYLVYVLLSSHFSRFIEQIKVGCTIAHLNQEKFLKYEFPLPTIEEQLIIIELFDNLSTVLSQHTEQIRLLDELIKARFVEMFGTVDNNVFNYPIVRLGDYAKLQGGYAFKSKDFTDKGIPLVQIGNVNKDFLDWEVINTVPEEFLLQYDNFSLHTGDLVMAMTRPIIKSLNTVKVAKVSEADVPCLLNQRVGRFILSDSVTASFLEVLCKTDHFKDYVERMSGNSLQPNISSKQVEDYMVILPPVPLQNTFSCFVQQVDKTKVEIQKSLDETQKLFDSLMQQYFGE